MLVLAWKQRFAGGELGQNAPQRPHVDLGGVFEAQDDLRRAVEAGLDVRVDALFAEAAAAKVNDLRATTTMTEA